MTINWVRLGLAVVLLSSLFFNPLGVDYEMVRLFKLLYFLFSVLLLGLAVEVKK